MTTSINLSSCFENPQSALISAFQRRNLDAFKYALEHLRADPNIVDPRIELSIFEKVLMTPDSSDYVSLCIDNGADLYSKNAFNRYPLHYAVDSLCPDNLRTFLKFYDQRKINVKYGNKNCLHILTGLLPSNENYEEVSECIKILVRNGCDLNMPNEKSLTPFHTFLRKQSKLRDPNDLMDFFLTNASVDVYTYKADDMKKLFEKQNPNRKLPEKVEKVVDCDYMLCLLRSGREAEFEVNFKLFKDISTNLQSKEANDENKTNSFAEDCAKFLYTAVQNDMTNAVDLLLSERINVNRRPEDAKCQRPAAFLACASGYHRILDLILRAETRPETTFNGKNLLHEVCHHFGTDTSGNSSVDYQKCFSLVVDLCNVNEEDNQGSTPLHYAVRYRNDEAIKKLLEKSSYIGTKNCFGETPIDDINREVFEEFLDSRVTANVNRSGDEEHEVTLDYNFLVAPKISKTDEEFRQEIAPLQRIAKNSELRPLILHPLLSSFLYLKWSKLRLLFYGNFLLFSLFMLSLIVYIVLCQSIPADERNKSAAYCFFYVLSMISLVILMLREIFQCVLSVHNYIKSPVNWFEIVLIILGWTVLLQSNDDDPNAHQRIIRAVTILFAAYEFLQLVGTLPILSISTHMVILKKVAITFLKSIALYSILLIAFAMSFYTLFGGKSNKMDKTIEAPNDSDPKKPEEVKDESDEFNSFAYPGIAIIKTFVMLTGEFDASSLDLDSNGVSYCIIFLLFVFLVTIVLFNLLNALAVDDTQVIKAEGQLVDLCQRISVLNKYEKIILSRSGSWRWLKSIISIFPHTIPNGKIVIRPNRSNEILTLKARQSSRDVSIKIDDGQEQELQNLNNSSLEKIIPNLRISQKLERYSAMDPKIMKAIRVVLDQRNQNKLRERKEEVLLAQIRSMKSELKILSDFMMKSKAS